MPEALELRYVPLGTVRRWDANPKLHDLGALASSFVTHGFKDPMKFEPALNRGEGGIVEGNGRAEALAWMKGQGQEAPRGIVVDGEGKWLVPVLFGVDAESEAAAEAYGVDHNSLVLAGGDMDSITAALGLYDPEAFSSVLERLGAEDRLPISVPADDYDAVLGGLREYLEPSSGPPVDVPDLVDHAAELQGKWGMEAGMAWEAPSPSNPRARHRLMCGDSTYQEHVNLLLGSAQPRLIVTDPPYGVEYDPAGRLRLPGNRPKQAMHQIPHDDQADWRAAWSLVRGHVVYCWHGALNACDALSGLLACRFVARAAIVWVKPHAVISRGHYHWQHERCAYAVREGQGSGWCGPISDVNYPDQHEECTYAVRSGRSAEWLGERKQTTVWTIGPDDPAVGNHPTQKPIECFARAVRNHRGDVHDPFVGTGTAIVAAEQCGRSSFGMDISPAFIAVALERLSLLGLDWKPCHG